MQSQLDNEMTDMATFIYELGNRLKKEGSSLQSLAKTWFGEDNDEYYDCRQIGIDIRIAGKIVLDLRKHLCRDCKLKNAGIRLDIESISEEKPHEKDA